MAGKRVRRTDDTSPALHGSTDVPVTEEQTRGKRRIWVYFLVVVLVILLVAVGYFYTVTTGGIDLNRGKGMEEINLTVQNYEGYTRKDKYYTFLVVGTDASGLNTDTILVSSFDTVNNKVNILQVPRDSMLDVDRNNRKVNASFAIGQEEQLEMDLENLIGIPIDRYVVVSIQAFRDIVDAVGGVEINVPQAMQYEDPYQDLVIDLQPGVQTLNGVQAEGFVRYRSGYADADIGRLKAQKAFISAFMKKLFSVKGALQIPELVNVIGENLKTNLNTNEMIFLATKALSLGGDDIRFFTLTGENYRDGIAYYALYKEETMQIINTYFNPFTTDLSADKFHIVEFERKENNQADLDGDDLTEASNVELSQIKGEKTAENATANPENSKNLTTATQDNSPLTGMSLADAVDAQQIAEQPSQEETNDNEEQSDTVQPAQVGEGPASSMTTTIAQPSTSENMLNNMASTLLDGGAIKVELINASGDKTLLATTRARLENNGCEVVWEETTNTVQYSQTVIINLNGRNLGNNLIGLFPGCAMRDDDKKESEADVTVIIGADMLS